MIDRRETPLIRPNWEYELYHRKVWQNKGITVIMCERDTLDITRLALESLLTFYPDIPVLVIDGGSTDGTVQYIQRLCYKYPNITLWQREGRNGHGTMLDEGINTYIKTKYVLLMDSDVIVKRGGWIEMMLERMNSEDIYAIGTLMQVTDSKDGIGEPINDGDILRYAHPSCSIIRRETYLTLPPFVEHGAPLVFNMQAAKEQGLRVEYFPIEYYCAHLSGASWVIPRTIWRNDMGVHTRPFVTFIIGRLQYHYIDELLLQDDRDFDIALAGEMHSDLVAVHNEGEFEFSNRLFPLRHLVTGDYICVTPAPYTWFPPQLVSDAKKAALALNMPDEFVFGVILFIKRELWQVRDTLS